MKMQAVIAAVYPPQCVTCDAQVSSDFGLCPACWRATPFITGLTCGTCGAPVAGEADGTAVLCDDCLATPRPWAAGAAAMLYRDNGRRLVLALKHGDRMELARPAVHWLRRAAEPLVRPGMVVVPVPLHWLRLLRRRYNQAALLSGGLARAMGLAHCPDALLRRRNTGSQEGRDRAARFAALAGAFVAHPRRRAQISGRPVLLVDDVMTSGATFAGAATALLAAGATEVCVLSLARVAKDA